MLAPAHPAADWLPVINSPNSLRSTARPSAKGRFTAASMQRILYSGARKPRNLRALALRKSAKISGLPRAASTLVLLSRTLTRGRPSATALRAKAMAPSLSLPSSTSSSIRPMARASLAGA